MAEVQNTENKQFLDAAGVSHLWSKVRERYDSKIDRVNPGDASVRITDNNTIAVRVSPAEDNGLRALEDGLFAIAPEGADVYTITRMSQANPGASASYRFQRYIHGDGEAQDVPGAAVIDIPKDMVVSSGTVEVKATSGAWGRPGTYIHLVLANAENSDLYINVGSLIEYVTSGSGSRDMVRISIDAYHRVTASITDGTVTRAKLDRDVTVSLNRADTAVQKVVSGEGNGQIKVDGKNVDVHGLKSAAYAEANEFDPAGAAEGIRQGILDALSNKIDDVIYNPETENFIIVKGGTERDPETIDIMKTEMGLGNAAYRDVTDVFEPGVPRATDTNLVTGRTVFYAMRSIAEPESIPAEQIDALFS